MKHRVAVIFEVEADDEEFAGEAVSRITDQFDDDRVRAFVADTTDMYQALQDKGLAVIVWNHEDVETVSKLKGPKAADWLFENRKHIQDRSTELGWEVIGDLLDPEDRKDDSDD